jgi:hypothetical protein
MVVAGTSRSLCLVEQRTRRKSQVDKLIQRIGQVPLVAVIGNIIIFDFETFVLNHTRKQWVSLKLRFSNYDFLEHNYYRIYFNFLH